MGSIGERYVQTGRYINLKWDARRIISEWKSIEDPHADILLSADYSLSAYCITSKDCFEKNMGPVSGLLALPAEQRSCIFDATFKLERRGGVLSSIGTTTVRVSRTTQVRTLL